MKLRHPKGKKGVWVMGLGSEMVRVTRRYVLRMDVRSASRDDSMQADLMHVRRCDAAAPKARSLVFGFNIHTEVNLTEMDE